MSRSFRVRRAAPARAIYVQGVAAPRCVSRGEEGRIAPDAGHIAVARGTGSTGSAYGPGFQTLTLNQHAIDIATVGEATATVVTGAVSFQPPLMVWNAAGTYLLVLWPHATGL
jgi:hypothetical protein